MPRVTQPSVADMQAEVHRRLADLPVLKARRAELRQALVQVDRQIAALEPRSRKRPGNNMTLRATLQQVLRGKVMSVPDIMKAVFDTGYATSSSNFRFVIYERLADEEFFRRVSKGHYTARTDK